MQSSSDILDYLAIVAPVIPFPIYWANTEPRVLGANQACLDAMGAKKYDEVVGRMPHEYYPKEIADNIISHVKLVIQKKQTLTQEDVIQDITTGKKRYYAAIRSPLIGSDGKIIGIVGTSIETTAEKEAEYLIIENRLHKIKIGEQEKFQEIIKQVAHDIRSPLASMSMIVKSCQIIPERERVALREAANTINDIANNLLKAYVRKETDINQNLTEKSETILVSPVILQILTDKKYQYQKHPIKFDYHFSQTGSFAWIKIEPTAFKRMLSNVINNAVDAFDKKEGKINLYLDADEEQVKITIEDNGKGMKPELLKNIMNNVAVTEGKANGHGIGLTQVRQTLQNNQGQWLINSQVGAGTRVTLTFPRSDSENWIAEVIQLNNDDVVVILDDDTSIHLAWDIRFDKILKKFPNLTVKHFESGEEAVAFINQLKKDQRIFLLTDYELLNQTINGLQVIEQTGINHAILVTSHYANATVIGQAARSGTKILPKQLAPDIPIVIHDAIINNKNEANSDRATKVVDAVLIDDNKVFLDCLSLCYFDREIDVYDDPRRFLECISQYDKNTKIIIDYNFNNYPEKGTQVADQLHRLGFARLYLLSGQEFSKSQIPNYLTLVAKTNVEQLKEIFNDI
jgi:signal transduction histidine kinase